MAIKSSNLYCYYVINHHAIKVGFGESSAQRMRDYSKLYKLEVEISSLKNWKIPVSGLAQTVENSCHIALLDAGLEKHIISNEEGQEAHELFHLGNTSYQDAVLIVAGTIDETIQTIVSKLGHSNSKNIEESRRKKEENRILKDTILAKKNVEFERKVQECSNYIKSIWNAKFKPVIDISEKTREININFQYRESTLKRLFTSEKNPVIRMYKWPPYERIRELIVLSLQPQRVAKSELVNIYNKFKDDKVIQVACKNTKLRIFSPGNVDLCLVDNPLYQHEWALIEIRLIVQHATYFGGDDAIELINLDSVLQKLVKKASLELPPELLDTNWNRY
jgi:hypothetical protein